MLGFKACLGSRRSGLDMSNPDLTHYANKHYDPHNLRLQDVSNSFRDLPGITVLGNCHSGNPGTNPVVTGEEKKPQSPPRML